MRYFLILFIISSCAHKKRSIVNEIDDENISIQTVLDLARTSYLRGCVDSKNHWYPKKNVRAFPKCKEMAKLHQQDINAIINNNLSNEKLKKHIKKAPNK